jgi:hypothetical protein
MIVSLWWRCDMGETIEHMDDSQVFRMRNISGRSSPVPYTL